MARLVLEIMQTSPKPTSQYIPLSAINPIHPTDNRESTVKATRERATILAVNKERFLKTSKITKTAMAELMPSLTHIRVVSAGNGQFFCFEGNGRIAALKTIFTNEDRLHVEVDVFQPKRQKRVLRNIRRLRAMHNM